MNAIRNVLVFLILLGVIFFIFNIQFTSKRKRIIECKHSAVDGFQMTTPHGKIGLEKEIGGDGKWMVTSGFLRDEAERKVADVLSKVVCYLPYVEKFSIDEQGDNDLASYGLEKPQYQITIFGEDTVVLSLGNLSPSGTEYFASSSANPGVVYAFPNKYKQTLTLTYMDIRARRFFYSLEEGDLLLKFEEQTFRIKGNGGDQWEESDKLLSAEETRQVIHLLRSFLIRNFHGPLSLEKKYQYGFHLTDLFITLKNKNQPIQSYEVSLFDGYYHLLVKSGEEIYVFLLDRTAPEKLFLFLRKKINLTIRDKKD
jgi:hypothetical protein